MVNYACDPTSHDKFGLGSAMWVVLPNENEVTEYVGVAFFELV